MKLRSWLRPVLAAVLAASAAQAQAPLELRVALVIGNAAYAGPAALVNPVNDAAAMTATLRTLGFDVHEVRDANRAQMLEAIDRVQAKLKAGMGIGVLYFAGHGLQLDYRNYMVPVDARLQAPSDVPAQAVDVGAVMDAFRRVSTRLNIVVLDACRDNPFASSRSGRGLAPIDAPSGSFFAYATAPGNVAEDGDDTGARNGLYTGFLVRELQRPAARIEDVFKRVRLQVRQKSQGRQIPWESTSLEDDFYFNDGVKYTFQQEDVERLPPAQRLPDFEQARQRAREEARIRQLATERAREEAFQREKARWELAQASRRIDDLYAFLQEFPSGYVTEQAQIRLDQWQRPQVEAQVLPGTPKMLPPGAKRYVQGDEFEYVEIDGFSGARRVDRIRVTRADDDVAELNDGQQLITQEGVMRRNRFGRFEPGVLVAPSELFVGKRWKTAFETTRPDGVRETAYFDFRITALEDVTVPAGTFLAYRIEGTGVAIGPMNLTHLTGRQWVDPLTMHIVRWDREFRDGGRLTERFSRQLVRARLVPRP